MLCQAIDYVGEQDGQVDFDFDFGEEICQPCKRAEGLDGDGWAEKPRVQNKRLHSSASQNIFLNASNL